MKKFYARLCLTFVLSMIAIVACSNHDSNVANTNPSAFISPSDTSIYNNVGVWHNEFLTGMVATYNNYSDSTLRALAADWNWIYANTFGLGYKCVKSSSTFAPYGIDSAGMYIMKDMFYSNMLNEAVSGDVSACYATLDSFVTVNGLPVLFSEIVANMISFAEESNYSEQISNYMYSLLTENTLTNSEEIYLRTVASVAMHSLDYWNSNPIPMVSNKSDKSHTTIRLQGGNKDIQLSWLAAAGICDLIGAACSVASDCIDGSINTNSGWKTAGKAAVWGLGTSATVAVGVKIKIK